MTDVVPAVVLDDGSLTRSALARLSSIYPALDVHVIGLRADLIGSLLTVTWASGPTKHRVLPQPPLTTGWNRRSRLLTPWGKGYCSQGRRWTGRICSECSTITHGTVVLFSMFWRRVGPGVMREY